MFSLHRTFVTVCVIGLTNGCLRVPADLDTPSDKEPAPTSAAEVLDRYVAAIGGESVVRKIAQRTVEARLTIRGQENCPVEDETCVADDRAGSFLMQTTADRRLYRRTVVGELVDERGYDGKNGWQVAGGNLRLDTPKEAVLTKEDAALHWYLDVEKRKIETELLPPRKEDSKGTALILDGIRWTIEKGPTKELWFARTTGLLHEERMREGEGDQVHTQTIVYSDYKKVDEVLVAHHIEVVNQAGDNKQVMEFAAQKITHSAIDASRFAVPKLPPPKPQPDERLEGLAKARDKAKSQPRDLDTQLELMRAAWAAARFDEAAAAANKAVQLEHSEPEALFILSQIQILQGDLSGALKTLARAKSAGVRPEVATLQQAPVFYRTREYGRLADALDDGGQPTLAGRYRSFAGKPLQPSFAKDACVSRTPLSVVQNLAVVQISIGEQTIPAVLDTGAAELILAKSLSGPLEVSVTTSSTLGPEGPQADFGQTDKIRIGDLTLSNVPIAVMADEALLSLAGEHDEPVRAVVGTGMLTDFQITFDLPKKEFVVIDGRSKCKRQRAEYRKGTATPFYLHEKNYIYVRGSLNGAEGLYLINTGMQGGDMAANQLAYAHAGIGAPVLRSDRTPLVKTGEVRLGEAFSASGLESVYGFFEIQQSGVGFRVDGMLGLGAFENHALTLDFTEQRLYATPSTSP